MQMSIIIGKKINLVLLRKSVKNIIVYHALEKGLIPHQRLISQ